MTTVAIVVALVVVVAVAVLLLVRRGPAQLQQGPAPRPLAQPRAAAPAERAAREEQEPKPAPNRQPAPAKAPPEPPIEVQPDESLPGQPTAAPTRAGASVPPASRDVAGLRKGLSATRGGFIARLTALFQGKKEIDPAILEQVEEVMLASDVGPKTTQSILARLRDSLQKNELRDTDAVWAALRAEAKRILDIGGGPIRSTAKPTVVLMVGVNGVGKTTTIGKLATHLGAAGKKVVLAAGDTFRAAAVQQLEVWGKRVGAEVVRGKEGADPGAVAFDATT